ncbi:hypothetical protein ACDP63_16035 [Paracoccus sp. P2]|uniref:Uncharacterized protein n=1 Tax=Paracoccus pantotrophus TaxID=82367 RepID=A0A1I5K6W6_PARPN|nr:hypothetical protein [Paracoccus pantotrophus]MDF3855778.1 hypothetical protein [Paracoccus pantotrophus]QFG35791.1 hypothetical protein ESD82_06445 [Paracoccus pantotrophus]QLH14062.1 hypothetical protein HYQ43_07385 [Paracoccus pantotrophus]RDD97238.1 hypothetical protein DTW92_08745 [Paracoccus pantotrophus]RKS43959.1 hypothetical protein BDE18_2786 [Paracoccus pantotrophus]
MNNLIWLIRASRWARNPPSAQRVKLVLAVIAAGLLLAGLEHVGLWPDWATTERPRGIQLQRP